MSTFILYVIVIVLIFKYRGLAARHEALREDHQLLNDEFKRFELQGFRRRGDTGAEEKAERASEPAAEAPPRTTESLVRKVRDLRERTEAAASTVSPAADVTKKSAAEEPGVPESDSAPAAPDSGMTPEADLPKEELPEELAAAVGTGDEEDAQAGPDRAPEPVAEAFPDSVPDRYRGKGARPTGSPSGPSAATPPAAAPPPAVPPPSPVPIPAAPARPAAPLRPARAPITTADLSKWFLRGGLVILTIGIAYFARLVVPSLSPAMKVALSYLGAIGLFGLGRANQERLRDFARPVMAGGLAIGFFVSNAAYFVEGMRCVPMVVSLAWSACGVASMVFAAERWKSQYIAGLAIFLGHVAAFIAAGDADTFSLVSIAFLSATAVVLFIRNDWPPITLFAVVAAYASHFLWGLVERPAVPPEQMFWTNFIFLSSYYAIFVGSDLFWRGRLWRGEEPPAGAAMRTAARAVGPVNLIAYVSFVSFLHILAPGYFADIHWYFFALGGFQIALGFAHRKFRNGDWSFYPALGVVFLTIGLFSAFGDLRLNLILAAEALILLLVAHRTGLWLFRGLAQAALMLNFFHYWFIQTASDRASAGTPVEMIGGLLVVSVYFVKARLEEIWYGAPRDDSPEDEAAGSEDPDALPEGEFGKRMHALVSSISEPFRPILPHAHSVGGALVLFHQCMLHFEGDRELIVAAAFLPVLAGTAAGLRSVPLLAGWLTLQITLTMIGPPLRGRGMDVPFPAWGPLVESALGWSAALLPALALRFARTGERPPEAGTDTIGVLAGAGFWFSLGHGFLAVSGFPPHTPALFAGWIGATTIAFLVAYANHAPASRPDFGERYGAEEELSADARPDPLGLSAQAAAVIVCFAAHGFLDPAPRLALLYSALALVPLAAGLALRVPFLLTSHAIIQSGLLISLAIGVNAGAGRELVNLAWRSALPALLSSVVLLQAAPMRFVRTDRVLFTATLAQGVLWGALVVMAATLRLVPPPMSESIPLGGWLLLFAAVVLHIDRARAVLRDPGLELETGSDSFSAALQFGSAAAGCFAVLFLYPGVRAAFEGAEIGNPLLLVVLSAALTGVTAWRRNPAVYPAALMLLVAGYVNFYLDRRIPEAGIGTPAGSLALVALTLAIALAKDFALTRLDPPLEGERLGLAEALTYLPYALGLMHLSNFLYHQFDYPNCFPAMAACGAGLYFALAPRAMRRGALAGCLLLLGSFLFAVLQHIRFDHPVPDDLIATGAAFAIAMALERMLARNADFGYQIIIPGVKYPMRRTVLDLATVVFMLSMYASPMLGPEHRLTTVGWVIFGTGMIGWALLLRSTLHLRVGTVVVLISLARVLLVDTRNLDEIYKTIAYIFVGVCMIAVAWLFGRFNERMRTL